MGGCEPVAAQGDLLLYRRQLNGRATTVALNLGAEPLAVTSISLGVGKILLSTFLDRDGEAIKDSLDLRGNEGVIVGEDHAS
jgi:alpha-glucosidase